MCIRDRVPSDLREKVSEIAGLGGTPLTVCENNKILGVIYLKDTVKDVYKRQSLYGSCHYV